MDIDKQASAVRIFFALILSALGATAASPPGTFCNGTFCNGTLAVGASLGPPPASGPNDGYEANLYAYYSFDESSTPIVDSANDRNLSNISCGAVASSSGFIGTSHQINCYTAHTSPKMKAQRTDDGSADFSFPNSFTVRMWVKTSMTANSDWRNIIGEDAWNIYMGTGSSDHNVEIFLSGNSGDTDLESTESVNDGNWHRIIAWFDSSNGEVGIQIDDHDPTTTTQSDRYLPTGTTFFIGDNYGDSPDFFLDEVALWKDYVLTADDRAFDWNSGAGRTYPLP